MVYRYLMQIALGFTILLATSLNSQVSNDPRTFLSQVAETYRQAPRYYFEGEISAELGFLGGEQKRESILKYHFLTAIERPARVRAQLVNPDLGVLLVSDGQMTWRVTMRPSRKEYRVTANMAGYLLTDNYFSRIDEHVSKARIVDIESVELDGASVSCVVIETTYLRQSQSKLPSFRKFWIDSERMFILKEESDSYLLSNGVFVVPITGPFKVIRNETRITSLKISDSLADSLFRFIPPSNMKEVEEFTREHSDITGSSAPDFGLKDLKDASVKLNDLHGKVILIEFWASWCSPCRRALPIIEQLNLNFKDRGLKVLGISSEAVSQVSSFLDQEGYTFQTLIDKEGIVTKKYGVQAIPTTVLIDRAGKVILYKVGFSEQIDKELRAALRTLNLY